MVGRDQLPQSPPFSACEHFTHQLIQNSFSVEHKIIHAEICRLVVELIVTSSENSTLFQKVMEPESLEVLFELSSQEGNLTGFRYGMNIIAYMLQIINPDFRGSDLIPMTADISHLPLVAQKMLKSTPILLQQVISPPVSREITNQMGKSVLVSLTRFRSESGSFWVYQTRCTSVYRQLVGTRIHQSNR